MGRVLREAGLDTTKVNLLDESPYPAEVAEYRPLRLALGALHRTAVTILGKHGFVPEDLTSLWLHATRSPGDDHWLVTRAIIISASGQTYASYWM